MDKRTILAFILSLIVIVGWSFLYNPKPEKIVNNQHQDDNKQEKFSTETDKTAINAGHDSLFQQVDNAQDIIVETELYKAVFSGSRPQIKSFQLKKFLTKLEVNSTFKELIHINNSIDYGFRTTFSGETLSGIKWAACKVNGQDFNINTNDQPTELIYKWQSSQPVDIETKFIFYPDRYEIDLSVSVKNKTGSIIKDSILLNLASTPNKESKMSSGTFSGMALYLNNKLKQINTKKLLKKENDFSGSISWVAYEEPYFMKALIGEENDRSIVKSVLLPDDIIEVSYLSSPLNLEQNMDTEKTFTLYFGPRDLYILKDLNKKLEKAIYFGWFDVIAKPLLITLRFINKYISNYGVSIIILTFIIKILFWPLTHKSYKSMKEMRKLQPMMAKIREKYKNNKEEMQKQLMGLYKTYKINPMGGCLPIVIQIPVFFALFRILPNSIELRHAPFVFWIKDLSAPDRLFSFPFEIPFMTPPYGIPILTLLMGASMFLQQKMTPTVGDPAQAKIMMFLPVIFTFLFINFPSGLVVYWLTNNILSIAQQYRINKMAD